MRNYTALNLIFMLTLFYTEHDVFTVAGNEPGTTSFYIEERCSESSEQDPVAHHCSHMKG